MSRRHSYKVGQRNAAQDKKRILDIRQKAADISALTLELQPDVLAGPAEVPALPTLEAQPMKASPAQMQGLRDGTIPGGFVGEDESCPVCGPEDVKPAWDMCCMQADEECCNDMKEDLIEICQHAGWVDALPPDALAYMQTMCEDEEEEGGEIEISVNVSVEKSAQGGGAYLLGEIKSTDGFITIPAGAKIEAIPTSVLGTVRAVKNDADEWQLDVLGVPFGGPNGGRDSDGEYFSNQTKLHLDKFPTPPIAYYHGFDENGRPQGEPQYIGKTISTQAKNDGVWFRVVLDKANAYAKRIWEAAKQGIARASSGSIAHMVRKDSNGHITHWPVVELSLIDAVGKRQPANQYAVALPVMKAVYAQAGITLPDDIESIPQDDKPEADAKEAQGIAQVVDAAKSKETTTDNTNQQQSNTGVYKMDPNEVQTMIATSIAAALKQERDAAKAEADAKAKEEAEIQKRIDAAVAAKTAELEAAAQKASADAAKERRLPNGNFDEAPNQRHFANLDKYDNVETLDLAFAFGLLDAAKMAGRSRRGMSEDLRRALAIRIMSDQDKDNLYVASKSALKSAGIFSMKANEVNQSTLSTYGDEWIGVTYSTQLWEKIRLATVVAAKIPTVQVPQGSESIIIPVQSTSPTFYVVAQAASQSANPGRVNPTFTTSKEATANKTLSVSKLGAAVPYSGELEEDSILPWVAMLRADMIKEGAEVLEHVIIDGDTDLSATTNINHIGGTPGGTEAYTLFNGFRKLALITNTANKRDKAGALAATDYLETVKLMGLGGRNASDRNAVSLITDMWTNWATMNLAEVKTRDVFVNPTIEGGLVRNLYGFEVIPSANMHRANQDTTYGLKANTAGKVDLTTPGNNLTGSILAVRWDQWKLGYKRDMTFEVQRDAISDTTTLVMAMRVGLINRDNEASSITFDITGV